MLCVILQRKRATLSLDEAVSLGAKVPLVWNNGENLFAALSASVTVSQLHWKPLPRIRAWEREKRERGASFTQFIIMRTHKLVPTLHQLEYPVPTTLL